MERVSFSSQQQSCRIEDKGFDVAPEEGRVRKQPLKGNYINRAEGAEFGSGKKSCKSGGDQGLLSKLIKIPSLIKSSLSRNVEKLPDLGDPGAVRDWIDSKTKKPLSRKLLLEYANDEVRAGVIQCSGAYDFEVRILESGKCLAGYSRLAETDPEMYMMLIASDQVPDDVRQVLKAIQHQTLQDLSVQNLMIKIVVRPDWPCSKTAVVAVNKASEAHMVIESNSSHDDEAGAVGGYNSVGEHDIAAPEDVKLRLAIDASLRLSN